MHRNLFSAVNYFCCMMKMKISVRRSLFLANRCGCMIGMRFFVGCNLFLVSYCGCMKRMRTLVRRSLFFLSCMRLYGLAIGNYGRVVGLNRDNLMIRSCLGLSLMRVASCGIRCYCCYC